jgi:hypothetical protein
MNFSPVDDEGAALRFLRRVQATGLVRSKPNGSEESRHGPQADGAFGRMDLSGQPYLPVRVMVIFSTRA